MAGPLEPIGPRDALVVIDVQNDFVDGSVAIEGSEAIVPVINRLIPHFAHVVFTQDWHPRGHVSFASAHGRKPGDAARTAYGMQRLFADHCVQDSAGAALHPGLHVSADHMVVRKGERLDVDSFSAFVENDRLTLTRLDTRLRGLGIERLVLAGLALYGCVRHSALDARRAGFDVVIIDDACRARPSNANGEYAAELAQAFVMRATADELLALSALPH
jgi:nicotinamidase/pyrazinamidase